MKYLAGFLVPLLLASCALDAEDLEEELGELDSEVVAANGVSLNGVSLNGVSLNGTNLTGLALASVSLQEVKVGTTSVTSVTVTNTQLKGTMSAKAVTGAGLIGAVFKGTLSNAAFLTLRLDAVHVLAAPNADLTSYAFSYQTSAGWTSLCGVNDAIAAPGTWNLGTTRHQSDSNRFTLSCRGSTFTKCLELGYKGDSLLDTYHQTCVRALRADYCGDGTAHTVNGTEINIFDKLGKQTDAMAWLQESNWTPDGALCLGKARVIATTGAGVPACVALRVAVPCVTSSWGLALIRTEAKP